MWTTIKTVEFEPFYKMCEDSVYYERMGELAFIYGGNKTYQQLMENGNGSDYMTFGFWENRFAPMMR